MTVDTRPCDFPSCKRKRSGPGNEANPPTHTGTYLRRPPGLGNEANPATHTGTYLRRPPGLGFLLVVSALVLLKLNVTRNGKPRLPIVYQLLVVLKKIEQNTVVATPC